MGILYIMNNTNILPSTTGAQSGGWSVSVREPGAERQRGVRGRSGGGARSAAGGWQDPRR